MGKQLSLHRASTRWERPPNRELAEELLKSFGATNAIFIMLAPGEVIRLQQLNKW